MLPAPRLILLAAIAGALAGAVAVYVSGGLPGNNVPGPAPEPAAGVAAADDAACAAKAGKARALADAAKGQVAAMLPADPPISLRTLAFNDPAGKPMSMADRAGKTVLLNLWATWCAPCRAEMPALDRLQQATGGDDFEVIAVNIDTGDDAKPKKFLADTGVAALGYYRDSSMGVFNDLKTEGLALGLPVTLLIDGDGCLLSRMNGPAEWSSPDATAFIEAARRI